MAVGDAEPLETRPHVAARRAGEEDVELGHLLARRSATASRTSGPLISLGSIPSAQPTPSFWNEPTTNAEAGRPSPPVPRAGRHRPGAGTRRRRSRSGCGAPSPAPSRSSTRAPPSRGSSPGCGRSRRDVRASLRSRRRTGASPGSRDGRGSTRARGCSGTAEVVEEERELTQMEDRLIRDPAGPPARPELDSERGGRATELPRLVGEHPLSSLLFEEQARVRGPVTRPQSDRRLPERPADRPSKAARVSRDVHRHGSRG